MGRLRDMDCSDTGSWAAKYKFSAPESQLWYSEGLGGSLQ
jgi:hypothetical protein